MPYLHSRECTFAEVPKYLSTVLGGTLPGAALGTPRLACGLIEMRDILIWSIPILDRRVLGTAHHLLRAIPSSGAYSLALRAPSIHPATMQVRRSIMLWW